MMTLAARSGSICNCSTSVSSAITLPSKLFGIVICNDSNYVEPARLMAAQGATALFVPTNNGLPPKRAGAELVAHDGDHRRVVDQLAAIHQLLRAQRHGHLRLDALAQDVARRNFQQPPLTCEPLRLRAFARARRPHHDHVQRHAISPGAAQARRSVSRCRTTIGEAGPVPAPVRLTLVAP